MSKSKLPPDPIPPLPDPSYDNELGLYAASDLRDVCGTRINPNSMGWYKHRGVVTHPNCMVQTAAHPNVEAWLADVQGFDPRAIVKQPPMKDMPLSIVIPQVSPLSNGTFKFPLNKATYIVNAMDYQSNPHTLPEKIIGIKKNLPEGSQLYMNWFGPREYIQGLWTLIEFWEAEALDEFDGLFMPDFSAFSDDPVPQYLLGERMQQVFAAEGSLAGKTIIPGIAWATEESFRRQFEMWSSLYPHVHTIAFDCYGSGVSRVGWLWRWLFAFEKYCQGMDHLRFVFAGISSGWAVRELNRIFPKKNYVLVTPHNNYVAAQRGSADREVQGKKFRTQIKALEDYSTGEVLADEALRPEEWPKFDNLKH